MKSIGVLSVVSEIYPIIKTGGLADVAGALPVALKMEGIDTRTLVPGYPAVMEALEGKQQLLESQSYFGGTARLLAGSCGALDLLVLDAPHLFARPGNPYLSPEGVDWPDNGFRFAALARMAANIGLGAVPSFVPDVVHSHDWQAALTPAYLHYSGQARPGTVMTIHNLAYQGRFPRQIIDEIGLPPESFTMHGVEYYGDIGFLKAGLQFADRITTVSPTYAIEIQGDEGGMGLGGLLRARSGQLRGILNGIDIDVWDPATDPAIPHHFSAADLDRRSLNKAALQHRFGLEEKNETVLLGVISRLSWQKGLDLLIECLPTVLNEGMQLVLLGSGDADLGDKFQAAAKANPAQIGVMVCYDEAFAHLIQAGADALVVPSRFEPCGLTQLCALRYGAVPIVSAVGGLGDTVVDAIETTAERATGFKFGPVSTENLAATLRRAHTVFRGEMTWRQIQQSGMSTDVSWRHRASQYADLYREVADIRPTGGHA
jgi:starch synthase